jgi:hypothetical protein
MADKLIRLASSTVFGVWPSIIAPTASDSFPTTVAAPEAALVCSPVTHVLSK